MLMLMPNALAIFKSWSGFGLRIPYSYFFIVPEFKLNFYKTDDGKILVILDVYKGDKTSCYYSGDGVLEAYVRV